MSNLQVRFDTYDRCSISIDEQHISRLTHVEVRDLIARLLVFGGKQLRDEIAGWLQSEKIQSVADFIAPESIPTKPRGAEKSTNETT